MSDVEGMKRLSEINPNVFISCGKPKETISMQIHTRERRDDGNQRRYENIYGMFRPNLNNKNHTHNAA